MHYHSTEGIYHLAEVGHEDNTSTEFQSWDISNPICSVDADLVKFTKHFLKFKTEANNLVLREETKSATLNWLPCDEDRRSNQS